MQMQITKKSWHRAAILVGLAAALAPIDSHARNLPERRCTADMREIAYKDYCEPVPCTICGNTNMIIGYGPIECRRAVDDYNGFVRDCRSRASRRPPDTTVGSRPSSGGGASANLTGGAADRANRQQLENLSPGDRQYNDLVRLFEEQQQRSAGADEANARAVRQMNQATEDDVAAARRQLDADMRRHRAESEAGGRQDSWPTDCSAPSAPSSVVR